MNGTASPHPRILGIIPVLMYSTFPSYELPVIFCNSAPNTWVLVPIPSLLLKVIAPVQLSSMSLHYSFFSTGLFPSL